MKQVYKRIIMYTILLLLTVASILVYITLKTYITNVDQMVDSGKVVNQLHNLRILWQDSETALTTYRLSGDSSSLQPYQLAKERFNEEVFLLTPMLGNDGQQINNLRKLHRLLHRQLQLMAVIIYNSNNQTDEVQRTNVLMTANSALINSVFDEMMSVESNHLEESRRNEILFMRIAPEGLLVFFLFMITLIFVLFYQNTAELRKRKITEERLMDTLTELREEAEERELAEVTLRGVLESSPNGILSAEAVRNEEGEIIDFRIDNANQKVAQFTGLAWENMLQRSLLRIFPDIKTNGIFEIYSQVINMGKEITFEHIDEKDSIYSISAIKMGENLVLTYSDITEARRYQAEIEEKELLLREAEAIAHMGSWQWEKQTGKMLWSNGMYLILDKSPEMNEPHLSFFTEHIAEEDREPVNEIIGNALKNKKRFAVKYRSRYKGGYKYFALTGVPRYSVSKKFRGFWGTLEDETEERVAENRLKLQSEDLQRSNEDLEQFAYVASHDLQEPLRKIRAFSDRLAGKYANVLHGPGLEYLERMESAAGRMQQLIQDLLSFSRVTAGNIKKADVDLNEVLKRCTENMETTIEQNGAEVIWEALPTIKGDGTQLERLFLNLVSNAIKFKKPEIKPKIDVKAQLLNPSEVQAELETIIPQHNYYRISVIDNGIGFDQKYADRIFNIFQRLHGRSEYEGTGIGLSVCRKIVMAHNGYIRATGIPGLGSEFILFFPH